MPAKTVKVAVSLPREEFRHVERIRRQHGTSRSAVISEALKYWIAAKQEQEKIVAYMEGYRRSPETDKELGPFVSLASEVLSGEEWKE